MPPVSSGKKIAPTFAIATRISADSSRSRRNDAPLTTSSGAWIPMQHSIIARYLVRKTGATQGGSIDMSATQTRLRGMHYPHHGNMSVRGSLCPALRQYTSCCVPRNAQRLREIKVPTEAASPSLKSPSVFRFISSTRRKCICDIPLAFADGHFAKHPHHCFRT